MDLVSICIPSYKPTHFRECLTSALAQTYKHVEILVSDDCPNDDVKHICANYPVLVNYVRNASRSPGAFNNILNLCRLAKGTYIKFLLDDDILHPFCVQYLVQAIEMGSSAGAVLSFSPRVLIDGANGYLGTVNMFNVTETSVLTGDALIGSIASTLLNPVGELTTVLMKREAIFDETGEPSFMEVDHAPWLGLADVAAWINMGLKGTAVIHPWVLSYFRQHGGAQSTPSSNREFILGITDWEKVLIFARSRGILQGEAIRAGYEKLVERYRGWLPAYPQLQFDIERIRAEMEYVSALRTV